MQHPARQVGDCIFDARMPEDKEDEAKTQNWDLVGGARIRGSIIVLWWIGCPNGAMEFLIDKGTNVANNGANKTRSIHPLSQLQPSHARQARARG